MTGGNGFFAYDYSILLADKQLVSTPENDKAVLMFNFHLFEPL